MASSLVIIYDHAPVVSQCFDSVPDDRMCELWLASHLDLYNRALVLEKKSVIRTHDDEAVISVFPACWLQGPVLSQVV